MGLHYGMDFVRIKFVHYKQNRTLSMPKFIKWIGGSLLVVAILYVIIQVVGALVLGPTWTHTYTKKDLIANYQAKKNAILAVKDYFVSIVPPHKSVEIEFTDSHTLSRLNVSSLDSATGATIYPIFLQWDLSTSSPQVDSVLAVLHWTQATLQQLKHKLDLAFCISIGSGDPCRVGFQRSGMGMYFYELFSKPIPDSLKGTYNNGCTYIIYNPTVVLEYGGGAIGPQCFPKE
jgi:hypothetical protein